MRSKLFTFSKYLLLLSVAILLLVFAFRGISVTHIIHNIFHANIFWILVSGSCSVIAFISRAYRWKLLIEPLGYDPGLRKTTYALMVGYLANLAFPRLGEVSRCGALSKAGSIPFDKLLGTVIVERIIDVISLLICMVMAAVMEYKRLGHFFAENIFDPALQKMEQLMRSPLAISIAVILLAVILFFIFYFIKRAKKKGTGPGIVKIFAGLVSGLRSIAELKRPGLFIFHSVFIWFLYYIGTYFCFFALPATGGLGFGAALFLLVASGIGMAAPVQGGIGAFHILVSQGLMLYGLSQQDGLTFATLIHGLQVVLVIIFGTLSLFLLFLEKKKGIAE